MTNEEVIAAFMEPRPTWQPGQQIPEGQPPEWWVARQDVGYRVEWQSILEVCPEIEKLGWLREVESRLSEEQWDTYERDIWSAHCKYSYLSPGRVYLHATPKQKINALASVLGNKQE